MSWWKRFLKLFKTERHNKERYLKQLLDYIRYRRDNEAKSIIDIDFIKTFDDARIFLHFAVLCGNDVITQHLIDLGYDVNAVLNDSNDTPLTIAVATGEVKTIKILLEANASIHMPNDKGETALEMVFSYLPRNSEIIPLFVNRLQSEFEDPEELVDTLIEAGCELLHSVMYTRDAEVIQCMIERGFDVNAADGYGRTALHVICQLKEPTLVELLIIYGADVNVVDGGGMTPLLDTARRANKEVMKILLEAGADPSANNAYHDITPIFLIFINLGDESVEVTDQCLELLFEHGALPRNSSQSSATLVDLAICSQEFKKYHMLINYFVMLQQLGTPVPDSVLDYNQDSVRVDVKGDVDLCRQRLNRPLFGSVSIFDLLTVSETEMKAHARNGTLRSELHRFLSNDQCREDFPYYCSILTRRIAKARRVVELEDAAIPVVTEIMRGNLNLCYVPAKKIVGYLGERDLENLASL